jgi:hypothetical protein
MNYFVFWEQLREIHYKTSLTQWVHNCKIKKYRVN